MNAKYKKEIFLAGFISFLLSIPALYFILTQNYKDDLLIQISNILKDFNISKIKMESNLTVIKASKTALESLKQEYNIGTKTITDLVNEESELLSN